jgi:uncharacterized membrane protein YedE/YeeE
VLRNNHNNRGYPVKGGNKIALCEERVMEELSPGAIAALGGLVGGMALGFAARWGRFCTLGAIEDATLANSRGRLSAWWLAIAVAMFGTFALDHAGLIKITDSFYLVSPTTIFATTVGAFLFGLGMSLVGTCGYGTLARIGGGDLKSIVTFVSLAVVAYATMSGLSAYVRVWLFGLPETASAPAGFAHLASRRIGGDAHVWGYLFAALIAAVALMNRDLRREKRYLITGLIAGLAITSGWFVTGYLAHDDFEPHRLESFTFTGPPGDALMYIMTATGASLEFGIGAVAGVILGACLTTIWPGVLPLGGVRRRARNAPANAGRRADGVWWCHGGRLYGGAGHVGVLDACLHRAGGFCRHVLRGLARAAIAGAWHMARYMGHAG